MEQPGITCWAWEAGSRAKTEDAGTEDILLEGWLPGGWRGLAQFLGVRNKGGGHSEDLGWG